MFYTQKVGFVCVSRIDTPPPTTTTTHTLSKVDVHHLSSQEMISNEKVNFWCLMRMHLWCWGGPSLSSLHLSILHSRSDYYLKVVWRPGIRTFWIFSDKSSRDIKLRVPKSLTTWILLASSTISCFLPLWI